MKLPDTLHRDYMREIDKLKQIAKWQEEKDIITRDEYNDILLDLYDRMGGYKRNIGKISFPRIEINNYENVNVKLLIDCLFSIG